jgi:ribose transport system substrate-binding protein
MDGDAQVAVPYPFFAKEGVETAVKLANGEKVPPTIVLPPTLVTKGNVNQFYDPKSPY